VNFDTTTAMSTVAHTTIGMILAAYWRKHSVIDSKIDDNTTISSTTQSKTSEFMNRLRVLALGAIAVILLRFPVPLSETYSSKLAVSLLKFQLSEHASTGNSNAANTPSELTAAY
jgi:hypothetical protein